MSTRADVPEPLRADPAAPELLRGVIQLLDSRAWERAAESLDTPDRAAAFLARTELDPELAPRSAAELARLRAMRDALVRAVDAPDDPAAWAAVTASADRIRLAPRFGAGPTTALRPTHDGDALLALLAVRTHEAILDGTWSRVRLCAREGCGLVFYDATKSRTRRWCSHSCGNRVNVARHRAKQAQPSR